MPYWGAGSTLGLLTCLGYGFFLVGANYLWRQRGEFTFWVDNELSSFRRNLSRHVPAGPFYERRGESRLVLIPAELVQSVQRMPRQHFLWGAFFLFLGLFLFVLDFFI